VDARSGETSGAHADVTATKSTAARESATDAAAKPAAEVATAKPATAEMTAAAAKSAATAVTTAAAAASEGVSSDRRHTEGDHRKNDTDFAQHGILHHGRDGVLFLPLPAYRSMRIPAGLQRDVMCRMLRTCAKLRSRSGCCADRAGPFARPVAHSAGTA
jgi:hypothetical protein